ncbi:MAG: right-handed parallel beta-helix repeat-containing protein [bacterium]|nr:right-handed parallel beta-helix repeat-containing protein [bacterium]
MARYLLFIALICSIPFGAAHASSSPAAGQCASLSAVLNRNVDAAPALASCLAKNPAGTPLRLSPGTYHLLSPLTINKPVTIETAASSKAVCSKATGTNCAVLMLGMMPAGQPNAMPVAVTAANVNIQSLAIIGDPARSGRWASGMCLNKAVRPLGGGIRVTGDNFRMANVLLKGVNCYSALEIVAGVKSPVITGNVIGPNGTHDVRGMWSDGVTIHDTTGAIVEDNLFRDNTDVQLIFGGCRNCSIKRNSFRHSAAFSGASFAELMIQAWPGTSGDYAGSEASGNDIDCGAGRRCGYGLMIGGAPWYPVKTSGGSVVHNRVANAQMGLNVDQLTGPMLIDDNRVASSGGAAKSDCGTKTWPATNISPQSRRFIQTSAVGYASIETKGCLLNRQQ